MYKCVSYRSSPYSHVKRVLCWGSWFPDFRWSTRFSAEVTLPRVFSDRKNSWKLDVMPENWITSANYMFWSVFEKLQSRKIDLWIFLNYFFLILKFTFYRAWRDTTNNNVSKLFQRFSLDFSLFMEMLFIEKMNHLPLSRSLSHWIVSLCIPYGARHISRYFSYDPLSSSSRLVLTSRFSLTQTNMFGFLKTVKVQRYSRIEIF